MYVLDGVQNQLQLAKAFAEKFSLRPNLLGNIKETTQCHEPHGPNAMELQH